MRTKLGFWEPRATVRMAYLANTPTQPSVEQQVSKQLGDWADFAFFGGAYFIFCFVSCFVLISGLSSMLFSARLWNVEIDSEVNEVFMHICALHIAICIYLVPHFPLQKPDCGLSRQLTDTGCPVIEDSSFCRHQVRRCFHLLCYEEGTDPFPNLLL